LVLELKLISRL